MKTRVFTVCVVIFLFLGVANAGISDGLVAYYPFNGNANDESGNGNNGAVNGATLIADRFGNANKAYSLDGLSDYINISSIGIYQSVTLLAWVKNYNGVIIGFDGSYFISVDSTNKTVTASTKAGYGCTSLWGDTISTNDDLKDNKWHNIAYTKNQSDGKSSLYIDGVLKATGNVIGYINSCSYGGYIGTAKYWHGGWWAFAVGLVDDVRIYNRAISASEIQQLYQGQGTCSNSIVTFTAGTPARATDVNANFDAHDCQIQALKAIVCQDHPTASICQ